MPTFPFNLPQSNQLVVIMPAIPPYDVIIYVVIALLINMVVVITELCARFVCKKVETPDLSKTEQGTLMVPQGDPASSSPTKPSETEPAKDATVVEVKCGVCCGIALAPRPGFLAARRIGIWFLLSWVLSWFITAMLIAIMGEAGILSMFLFAPQKASECKASCNYYSKDGLSGWVDDECCTYNQNVGQRDVWLQTSDGICFNGYLLVNTTPAYAGQPPLSMLYNHGSGGNIASGYRLERYQFLLSQGNIAIFSYDYAGYGKSCGETEAGTVMQTALAAAEWFAAWDAASPRWNLAPAVLGTSSAPITVNVNRSVPNLGRITVLGRSMGGAVSTYIGSQEQWNVHALAMQSAFSNLQGLAEAYMPMFGWILKSYAEKQFPQFDNIKNIASMQGKCLYQAHSKTDEWVPVDMAAEIRDAATGRDRACSQYLVVPDALHTQPLTAVERATLSTWLEARRRP